MLEKDGAVSFMEIKAEGDVIRRNQLTRLRQLGNVGIVAEIGRVDYRFDPEQDYVVVDIETTGGCWPPRIVLPKSARSKSAIIMWWESGTPC